MVVKYKDYNMPNKIKKIKNPCQFLLDSGLLYSINLTLLHPLGMAMEIKFNDDGTKEFGGIWDYRDDPEGLLFEDDTMEEGMEKFSKFMDEFGNQKLQERQDKLGFIIQDMPAPKKIKKNKPLPKMKK